MNDCFLRLFKMAHDGECLLCSNAISNNAMLCKQCSTLMMLRSKNPRWCDEGARDDVAALAGRVEIRNTANMHG